MTQSINTPKGPTNLNEPPEAPKVAEKKDVKKDTLEQLQKLGDLIARDGTAQDALDFLTIKKEAEEILDSPPDRAGMKRLKELYLEAVNLRWKMFPENVEQAMNPEKSPDFEQKLMDSLQTFSDEPGNDAIGKELQRMVIGLTTNPVDQMRKKDSYWTEASPIPTVNFPQVAEDLARLGIIEGSTTSAPLKEAIKKIEAGLQSLRAVDPMETARYDYQSKVVRHMDTRFVRGLGILFTGSMVALAIVFSIKNKTAPNKWAWMYGAGLAYLLKPNMFQGKERDQMETLIAFSTGDMRELLAELNPTTFEGLQNAGRKEIQALVDTNKRKEKITVAQIETIADKDSALWILLTGLLAKGDQGQEKLVRIISTFGPNLSKGNREIVEGKLKGELPV